MALALTDDEKEALEELRDSPAWLLFWNKVIPPYLAARMSDLMQNTRRNDAHEATYAYGRHEGAIDVLEALYKGIGQKTPEHINKLRRTSIE